MGGTEESGSVREIDTHVPGTLWPHSPLLRHSNTHEPHQIGLQGWMDCGSNGALQKVFGQAQDTHTHHTHTHHNPQKHPSPPLFCLLSVREQVLVGSLLHTPCVLSSLPGKVLPQYGRWETPGQDLPSKALQLYIAVPNAQLLKYWRPLPHRTYAGTKSPT